MENPVEREEYLSILHDTTGYSFDALRKQADITPESENEVQRIPSRDESAEKKPGTKRDKAELFVIASIAHGMPYVDFSEDVFTYLDSDTDRKIYQYAVEKYKQGEKMSVSVLYSMFDASDVAEVVEYDFMEGDDRAKYEMCLARMKIKYVTAEKTRLAKEYDETKNVKLVLEIARLDGLLKSLKNGGENE